MGGDEAHEPFFRSRIHDRQSDLPGQATRILIRQRLPLRLPPRRTLPGGPPVRHIPRRRAAVTRIRRTRQEARPKEPWRGAGQSPIVLESVLPGGQVRLTFFPGRSGPAVSSLSAPGPAPGHSISSLSSSSSLPSSSPLSSFFPSDPPYTVGIPSGTEANVRLRLATWSDTCSPATAVVSVAAAAVATFAVPAAVRGHLLIPLSLGVPAVLWYCSSLPDAPIPGKCFQFEWLWCPDGTAGGRCAHVFQIPGGRLPPGVPGSPWGHGRAMLSLTAGKSPGVRAGALFPFPSPGSTGDPDRPLRSSFVLPGRSPIFGSGVSVTPPVPPSLGGVFRAPGTMFPPFWKNFWPSSPLYFPAKFHPPLIVSRGRSFFKGWISN